MGSTQGQLVRYTVLFAFASATHSSIRFVLSIDSSILKDEMRTLMTAIRKTCTVTKSFKISAFLAVASVIVVFPSRIRQSPVVTYKQSFWYFGF